MKYQTNIKNKVTDIINLIAGKGKRKVKTRASAFIVQLLLTNFGKSKYIFNLDQDF